MKREKLNCEKARDFSILSVLEKLGHSPVRQSEKEAWFLSPLRSENRPSFKVSLALNRWYDFGEGKGGNVIDLVVLLKDCSVAEARAFLNGETLSFSFHQPPVKDTPSPKITIQRVKEIQHPGLVKYLHQRNIPLLMAQKYCKEVHYTCGEKSFFAIGLANRRGGWELRNPFFKGSTSPKDICLIKNKQANLTITEGMFDMLSLIAYNPMILARSDILVLNSVAFLKKTTSILDNYCCIELYLDRDRTGRKATQFLLSHTHQCIDMSSLYGKFNDMNQWWAAQQQLSG